MSAPLDPDVLLSLDDVAARLAVNRRIVRQLMDAGRLKYIRFGSATSRRPMYRFRAAWVEAFIDGEGD